MPASCSLRQGQAEDDYGSPTIILGNKWGTQGTSYQGNSKISPVRIKRQRSPAVGSTNSSTTRGRNKRRHHNSLFKQGSDGRIDDADAPLGDDTTEVETAAGIGIVIPDANTSYGQWGDRQASFRKFYERSIDTDQEVRIKQFALLVRDPRIYQVECSVSRFSPVNFRGKAKGVDAAIDIFITYQEIVQAFGK
ncbi:MAG: hypothetical protein LQ350_003980 [Teloschistes chrysophthalmus]|nr:MAG: hypothetical protein LQ350_003980 [Niorma chrysophthalma]